MDSSLAESTRKLYNKIWLELTNLCMVQLHEQDSHHPISISTLSLFLTYLFDKGYAPSTMITYNSAISYVHKLNGLIDPANSVFIQKMLQGAKKTRVKIDNRLPITKSILDRLVISVNSVCSVPYYQQLYKAKILVAFFGFLRIGEMTTSASNMQNHCLLLSNIEFHSFGFTICFHTHKHSVPGQTSTIVIKRQTKSELCPVVQLLRYIAVRRKKGDIYFNIQLVHPLQGLSSLLY
jgi:hypothetical protein